MKLVLFIVYSNLWIAFNAGWLAFSIAYYLKNPSPVWYGTAVGFATLAVYNLHRLLRMRELKKSNTVRHKWLIDYKRYQFIFFFIGGGASAVIFFYVLDFLSVYLFLGIAGIISALYAYKSSFFVRPLRERPYLKIYFIALCWTIMVALIPLYLTVNYNNTLLLTTGVLIYFLAIIIPFDIRDLPYDKPHQKTLPQLMGIKKSKRLAFLLLIVSYFLLGSITNLCNPWLIVAIIYQAVLIIGTTQARQELYYSGLIDGGIFLLGLFWWLLE